MNPYPWLDTAITQWQNNKISNKLPHAILISGSHGVGKKALSKQMALIAICDNVTDSGACLKCQGCHLFESGTHTDVTTIKAEKAIIKVEQIRKISKDITLSSSRNQYRIVIIENAEQMNRASANAILKTLEEPPKNVVIVLTTNEIGLILPTIQSRCFKLNIGTPSMSESLKWLNETTKYSNDELKFSLTLASGSPILASSILTNDSISIVKSMLGDLQHIVTGTKTILEVNKSWLSQDIIDHLIYISTYFLSLLKKINLGCNTKLIEYQGLQYLTENSQESTEKLMAFIKSIYRFLKLNQTGLKQELLLDELLISWHKNFKIDSN